MDRRTARDGFEVARGADRGCSMTWFVWSLHAHGEVEDALAPPL